jgi:hypothetical protein
MDERADGRSCHKHKGADIAGKQQVVMVVRKGELTLWGTDHAKLTSEDRSFCRESDSAWCQPKSKG